MDDVTSASGSQDPSAPQIALVTARFDAAAGHEDALCALLARYVVLTRHQHDCRNVDLVASATRAGRFLVVEKWESPRAARAHLDDAETVELARASLAHLAGAPEFDIHETISAHDLT